MCKMIKNRAMLQTDSSSNNIFVFKTEFTIIPEQHISSFMMIHKLYFQQHITDVFGEMFHQHVKSKSHSFVAIFLPISPISESTAKTSSEIVLQSHRGSRLVTLRILVEEHRGVGILVQDLLQQRCSGADVRRAGGSSPSRFSVRSRA